MISWETSQKKPHSFNHRFILGGLPRCHRAFEGTDRIASSSANGILAVWNLNLTVLTNEHLGLVVFSHSGSGGPLRPQKRKQVFEAGVIHEALTSIVGYSKDDDLNVDLYILGYKEASIS